MCIRKSLLTYFFLLFNFYEISGSYSCEMKPSEENIISQISQEISREKAFGIIVGLYQEPLYWHIRKMVISHDDAKDILQEAFIRVWKGLPDFKGDSKLFTWLFRIAVNEVLRFTEREKNRFENQERLKAYFDEQLETGRYINGSEIEIMLQKAILQLPLKQRMVFNMRYFDELAYDEISEILETSVNTVKVNYHHAKTKIEELIKHQIE